MLRPLTHLHTVARGYPGAWKAIDAFRAARGVDVPDWPTWCFCPMAASAAIVGGGRPPTCVEQLIGVSRLAALAAWFEESRRQAGISIQTPEVGDIAADLAPLISLLLYLCSESPDYGGRQPPGNPQPVKTKKGPRLFPPKQPQVWDVGVHIGAALRQAADHQTSTPAGGGKSKRPHVRRAHWHLYWTGKGRQIPKLNWLPPIPINIADPDSRPVVIKTIKET